MNLSESQIAALKSDILGNSDPVISQALIDGNNNAIVEWYNETTPGYRVWRSSLSRTEIYSVVDWSEIVNVGTGDLLAFQVMLAEGVVAPSNANVRGGISSIFRLSGNGSAPNTNSALLAAASRDATRAEKLFSSGGAGTSANPATMEAEGSLSLQNVRDALL